MEKTFPTNNKALISVYEPMNKKNKSLNWGISKIGTIKET